MNVQAHYLFIYYYLSMFIFYYYLENNVNDLRQNIYLNICSNFYLSSFTICYFLSLIYQILLQMINYILNNEMSEPLLQILKLHHICFHTMMDSHIGQVIFKNYFNGKYLMFIYQDYFNVDCNGSFYSSYSFIIHILNIVRIIHSKIKHCQHIPSVYFIYIYILFFKLFNINYYL